jgi:hypothetical protein
MAGAVRGAVEILGVFGVCATEEDGKRSFCVRAEDEMDVVGHEAEAEDLDIEVGGIALEKFQVAEAVGVGEEGSFAVVAAVGDVVKESGDSETW